MSSPRVPYSQRGSSRQSGAQSQREIGKLVASAKRERKRKRYPLTRLNETMFNNEHMTVSPLLKYLDPIKIAKQIPDFG